MSNWKGWSSLRASLSLGAALLCLSGGALRSEAQELTEGNAASWGTFASDGRATSVTNDSSQVKTGAQSIKFVTQSGFDTGVSYPAAADAQWDLTNKNYLRFWAYAVNTTTYGFQGNQPIVVLKTPTGSVRLEPQSTSMSLNAWRRYSIPLSGDSQWVRTTTGTPDLSRVNQIEIHQDTWDYGFTVYYDGLEFVQLTPGALPPAGPPAPAGVNPNAIAPKVLLYIYDPIVESRNNQRMHDAYGWLDPVTLTNSVISDLRRNSHDLVRYQVIDTKIVDAYPWFLDGTRYDDATFDNAWTNRREPASRFDYKRFIDENGIAPRIESGEIDEVWVYAMPFSGMWESTMVGDGGYWCNSGPVAGVNSRRMAVVMGWNYERGVAEALHSYGHRAESIMSHSYGNMQPNQNNNWNKFTLQDKDSPGNGGVGNIHFPVNGSSDYDYANTRVVQSNADDWYNYPNFLGLKRAFNFSEWSPTGADSHREYMNWWYNHLPHMNGRGNDYFLNNWWRYIADPDQFKVGDGNLYLSSGIPTVSTTLPANGGSVMGTVDVKANATVDGALGRVDFYVDGVYNSSDTMAPYTFRWDTSGLSGSHTIVTKAYELQNGTEAVSAPVSVTVGVPTVPTGLSATAGNAQVALRWTAASGVTSYNLYRGTSAGAQGTTPFKTGLSGTSYTDGGLTNGTTYFYKLAAVNANGASAQSGEVSARPQAPVPVAPLAPTNLRATAGAKRSLSITVSWTASGGATSYTVYRSATSNGTYAQIGTTSGTSFVNSGLRNRTTYYYKVAASNAGGSSTLAGPVSAMAQ